MISSARQVIACILLIWPTFVFAQTQTASETDSTGSVSGRVSVKGKGISGVLVGLVVTDPHLYQRTVQKTTTDEQGNYHFNDVQPGAYEVVVASLSLI